MANVLKSEKRESILALGRLGKSAREIAVVVGVRRDTVSKYLHGHGIPVRPPGWQPKPAMQVSPGSDAPADGGAMGPVPSESVGATQVSPDPSVAGDAGGGPVKPADTPAALWPPPPKRVQPSLAEPFRRDILSAVRVGRHSKVIWQDLVTEKGYAGSYKSVLRFVHRLRREEGLGEEELACGVILTGPGEEAQVDYGEGPLVLDPKAGRYRRTRLFALTLAWSRRTVWLLSWRSSSEQWCRLHEEAFRRLGGVPKVVVLDNLREAVIKPDHYEPTLNVLYAQMLRHYGVEAVPARVRDPDRKGKVERAVAYAQDAMRGLKFDTLEAAQAWLDGWAERWADTRIHGTTKREVRAAFTDEKPHLRPLPVEPLRYFEHGTRKVHSLDGCVEVEGAYYEAPPGMLGEIVTVQWDDVVVRLLSQSTGALLVEHQRKERGRHSLKYEHARRTPARVEKLLRQAECVGASTGKLCASIWDHEELAGVRRIQGVLKLATRDRDATEESCALALKVGVPTYKAVKKLLERRPPPLPLRQVDPLIRELTAYRQAIEARTGRQEQA